GARRGGRPVWRRFPPPPAFAPPGLPHVAGSGARANRGRAPAPPPRSPRRSRSHHYRLGQFAAARSARARGAPPGGARDAIRRNEYRDVEGRVHAAPQSLSPQSLDVENPALVYGTERLIRMRRFPFHPNPADRHSSTPPLT